MIGDRHLNDFSVEADGLTKYFGDYMAVDRVSLRVPAGSIYGVLGPNGAGKTTSLRMMLGIIDPDEGTSRLFGGLTPQSVRGRIGYLPEERGLYPGMKAREARSEEHTSELQSLMRSSYAVFRLNKTH